MKLTFCCPAEATPYNQPTHDQPAATTLCNECAACLLHSCLPHSCLPYSCSGCCQAAQSRLDALENDNPDDAPDHFGLGAGDEDDEFVMEESEEDGGLHWDR